jgi:hypothetical protein
MKYHCTNCNADFDEPIENKQIPSLLARLTILMCPNCKNTNINLTEHGKLMVERKAKIKKIESTDDFI